jgi:hypothetical protein
MAQRRANRGDRRAYWRDLIEQWEASGATQEAFCEARGVAVASLRWWKWRLGVEGAGEARRPQGRLSQPGPVSGPAFVPVRIVERGEPCGASSPGGAFELSLPGGVRLRVPGDFEAESLARLLVVLGERRAC